MLWFPQSPDLNPVEHLWDFGRTVLDNALHHQHQTPYRGIHFEKNHTLVESKPRNCDTVPKAQNPAKTTHVGLCWLVMHLTYIFVMLPGILIIVCTSQTQRYGEQLTPTAVNQLCHCQQRLTGLQITFQRKDDTSIWFLSPHIMRQDHGWHSWWL